ncbi:hypothetical protein BV25DRAFT_1994717 [Artomyces pyxidatus]|uniref:Uncharacterized protein n=1 Tax=Artomyces pyxidatus TaxID=48021 RepID=A0ACB8SPE3_9AGAM|nr:hypothetical protein BV25DRAFT_1994717 [Artomyces pyxidatus]
MSTLNKLAIRGIRSFDDKNISVIEFFSPVTVIVGHNGSGKTTIIECLKYATTGDQPPGTRGGAFVHDPKMANEKEVKAQVKLRFHAANGQRMLAVRNLSVTMKKTAGMTMKTLEGILALADGNVDRGKRGVISTKCAELDVEIPHLLGVSKAVLENVIFCHQEESYWPLSEPASLKKKFDDIFEATKYTKALTSIKDLRKDRMAELKAEKERLESLSLQKSHADKLRGRMSDLTANMATKETEYQETKELYQQLVLSNQKFKDNAAKFREIYARVATLQETQQRYQEELDEAKSNVQELDDTDEQLAERLRNFNDHIAQQKRNRRQEEDKEQDIEDELTAARKKHVALNEEHGQLAAEAKAQEDRIVDRETLIREMAAQYGVRGFATSPLEPDMVADFTTRLLALQRQQTAEMERIRSEGRARNEEYMSKSRKLHADWEALKNQRVNDRGRITKLQSEVATAEGKLEASEMLEGELQNHMADMDEKKARIEKTDAEISASKYEERLADLNVKIRGMEDTRDELTQEIRSLSLQSDSRAKLTLQQKELATKSRDLKTTLQISGPKFKKLVGTDPEAPTMEQALEKVATVKEQELSDLESEALLADRHLHDAETRLTSLKAQISVKKGEQKKLEKELKEGLASESEPYDTVDAAITATNASISETQSGIQMHESYAKFYTRILKIGQTRHRCDGCDRHITDDELEAFESYVQGHIKRASPESKAEYEIDLEQSKKDLETFQSLLPVEASIQRLKDIEIPSLERDAMEQEAALPALTRTADQASEKVASVKKELKDLSSIRQHAGNVSRLYGDVERVKLDIAAIEKSLASTGSTKTADDVQGELDDLSLELRATEKEKQNVTSDRERKINILRGHQNDLHKLQLHESELRNQVREKEALQKSIEEKQQEIVSLTSRIKDLDIKIVEGQGPIALLEEEYKAAEKEFNAKSTQAQQATHELDVSTDKLEGASKAIEKYVRDKRSRRLRECAESIERFEGKIKELGLDLERARKVIAKIDKEINEGGAYQANLRDNMRIRKLKRDIAAAEKEIAGHDMEEAARAKRNFEEKYPIELQKETDMQSRNARISGELSSLKSQLKTLEGDLAEYKHVNKQYTDQLVKVKMSDMANNDLEKYGKALDNAIMKYHSLKMEEVNDTMRHLWNKTYQGTDIDGIKIRSDSEGGASKRSYNYRVVMTKDQVEMDMRGRCSAGQKMLASIIIRLALSDSFGQNCGILALDEPTNALDTENIDALAESLVDIINERKNHANFQLIIITHDENFLRKLGQSDVMEYYWRVSRDSRQKSIIERQRFG